MMKEWHHFQGSGDFTIMEMMMNEVPAFTIQGRLAHLYKSTTYTYHAGLACGGPDIAFEVS